MGRRSRVRLENRRGIIWSFYIAVVPGEGLAKSAEICSFFPAFSPLAEAAIARSQSHGPPAFMATELGTGSRRGERRQEDKSQKVEGMAAGFTGLLRCGTLTFFRFVRLISMGRPLAGLPDTSL